MLWYGKGWADFNEELAASAKIANTYLEVPVC